MPASRCPRTAVSALACLLLAAALPALAGGIYQWKDAKGVTHYSDSPPPDSGYRNRAIKEDVPAPGETATVKPVVSPQCEQARKNVALLKGAGPVNLDADGDGKPDTQLDTEQRSAQLALAEATIRTSCAPAAKPAAG